MGGLTLDHLLALTLAYLKGVGVCVCVENPDVQSLPISPTYSHPVCIPSYPVSELSVTLTLFPLLNSDPWHEDLH